MGGELLPKSCDLVAVLCKTGPCLSIRFPFDLQLAQVLCVEIELPH
jgi:hypothetical protein